jgi:hypothetical protein
MLVAAAVFMVYFELYPLSPSGPEAMLGNQTRSGKHSEMADIESEAPFSSAMAMGSALAMIFIVKSVGRKLATRVGL